MGTLHGHTPWAHSMGTLHGHTPWVHSMGTLHGHTPWARVGARWTHGRAARLVAVVVAAAASRDRSWPDMATSTTASRSVTKATISAATRHARTSEPASSDSSGGNRSGKPRHRAAITAHVAMTTRRDEHTGQAQTRGGRAARSWGGTWPRGGGAACGLTPNACARYVSGGGARILWRSCREQAEDDVHRGEEEHDRTENEVREVTLARC